MKFGGNVLQVNPHQLSMVVNKDLSFKAKAKAKDLTLEHVQ